MRTLTFGLAIWAINIAVFAFIFMANHHPGTKCLWGLYAFWLLGASIPSTLEEIGVFLSEYLQLYNPAKLFLIASHFLYKLPLAGSKEQRSLGAIGLAKIAMMQGNNELAQKWADEAMATDCGSWRAEFRGLSVVGWAEFRRGEYELAEGHLRKSWEVFGSNTEGMQFKALADQLSEYHAINLDLLAQISLRAGRFDEAEQLFKRSTKFRSEMNSLKATATAYGENTSGAVAFARGDIQQAEALILKAVSDLPADVRLKQHRTVAVAILKNLELVKSEAAKDAYRALRMRLGANVHTGDGLTTELVK
jgi:Flp pilus assembly protein TadD